LQCQRQALEQKQFERPADKPMPKPIIPFPPLATSQDFLHKKPRRFYARPAVIAGLVKNPLQSGLLACGARLKMNTAIIAQSLGKVKHRSLLFIKYLTRAIRFVDNRSLKKNRVRGRMKSRSGPYPTFLDAFRMALFRQYPS
jgi:hypothetical protein